MRKRVLNGGAWVLLLLASCGCVGCAGSRSSAVTEQFFDVPGQYVVGPLISPKPRVGVPTPSVAPASGIAPGVGAAGAAAAELFWVADRAGRFNLIDRTRLGEMVAEQGTPASSASSELIHAAPLRGIDFILLCEISGLRVRGDDKPDSVSVARVEKLLHLADPKPRITTQCVVHLRLVEPGTGLFAARVEDSFQRTCSIEAMGLKFTNPELAWGELRLDEEQTRQVLRIVIDDAMRKLLPDVDATLKRRDKTGIVSTTLPGVGTGALDRGGARSGVMTGDGKPRASAMKVHCKECGFEATPDDQFCPNCGARMAGAKGSLKGP